MESGLLQTAGNPPLLDRFLERTLVLVGRRERTIQLVLGRGTPCQTNRTLVKRLQQGHFLITEAQHFTCRGSNSCFLIVNNNKMMQLIADSCARTGIDMKLRHCIPPAAGDTVMAYWDFARVLGQAAVACAIFVVFPSGQIEIVCLQARKVDILDDEEGDLMALRLLQDMILHSQGIGPVPEKGLMQI